MRKRKSAVCQRAPSEEGTSGRCREVGRRLAGVGADRQRAVKRPNSLSACLLRPHAATIFRSCPRVPSERPRQVTMKTDIHPEYATATVKCACGNTFTTRSTQAEIHTDVCAQVPPVLHGQAELIDTAGRVERFRQKYREAAPEPSKLTRPRDRAALARADEVERRALNPRPTCATRAVRRAGAGAPPVGARRRAGGPASESRERARANARARFR